MLGGGSCGARHEPGRTSVVPGGQPAPGRAALSPASPCASARTASSDESSSTAKAARRAVLGMVECTERERIDSAALPEMRRLDPERPEIHVALAAVVDLVVPDVEEQVVDRHLPLPERRVHFLEAGVGNLW